MNNYLHIDSCTHNGLNSVIQVDMEEDLSQLVCISHRNIFNPNLKTEYLRLSLLQTSNGGSGGEKQPWKMEEALLAVS